MSATKKAVKKTVEALREAESKLQGISDDLFDKRSDLEYNNPKRDKILAAEHRIDNIAAVLDSLAELLSDE